jgi:pre-rRNA-processing protein TSR3
MPRLYCLHYNECDPKKCSAIKLRKFNLLKIIKGIKGSLRNSIILNPFARNVISLDDRELILKYGLIVIDCSWKKLLKLSELNSGNYRKLPSLIAANPINYGKWEKLSSAEALAAALYITKFNDYGDLILSKFSWGIQFKKLNKF